MGGPQSFARAIPPGCHKATRPHIPIHQMNKHVALETARAGVGAALECFLKPVDNNALAFEHSRHVEARAFSPLRAESQSAGPHYARAVQPL